MTFVGTSSPVTNNLKYFEIHMPFNKMSDSDFRVA